MKPFIPFIVLFFLYSTIGSLPSILIHFVLDDKPLEVGLLSIVVFLSFTVFPTIWYVKKNGCREFFLNKKNILLLLFSLLLIISFDTILYYISKIDELLIYTFRYPQWDLVSYDIMHISFLVKSLIMAPIFETILTIGFLQKPLSEKMNPYIAIGITAVIFSISHLQFNYYDLFFYFFIGVAFGFIFFKTKNLLILILCHFIVNFISSCFSYHPQEANFANYFWLLIFLVLFIVSLTHLIKLDTNK